MGLNNGSMACLTSRYVRDLTQKWYTSTNPFQCDRYEVPLQILDASKELADKIEE